MIRQQASFVHRWVVVSLVSAFTLASMPGAHAGEPARFEAGNPYADGTSGLVLTPAERESLLTYTRSSKSLLESSRVGCCWQ